jgi:hypothetical protein
MRQKSATGYYIQLVQANDSHKESDVAVGPLIY